MVSGNQGLQMRGTWATHFDGGTRDIFEDEVDYFGLADVEVGLGFEELTHFYAVELLVALGAGAPDRGSAGGVEEAELDADGIGDFAHDAAKGVYFSDKMAFSYSANGWVAAHLGDEVKVHGDEGGLEAHAGGCHGGFAAGMTCADHGYIVLFGERHPRLLYGLRYRVSGVGERGARGLKVRRWGDLGRTGVLVPNSGAFGTEKGSFLTHLGHFWALFAPFWRLFGRVSPLDSSIRPVSPNY
jgi:hypothetical protein